MASTSRFREVSEIITIYFCLKDRSVAYAKTIRFLAPGSYRLISIGREKLRAHGLIDKYSPR